MKNLFLAVILTVFVSFTAFGQDNKPAAKKKTYAEITNGLAKIDGFLPLYLNNEDGKIYFEISNFSREFLYQISLPTGVGSNPIGLDRGQLGDTKVVYFERAGNKVLLVQPNYAFRATTDNAAERRAVEESFAKSVIWGFKIEASEGEKVLVDATSFLIRDAHGVSNRLNQLKQGSFAFEESRSALYLPNTKGFPKNTEVEATITLVSKTETGRLINQTAPSGDAVTVRERHSFVELPDAGYKPREFDPRTSSIPIGFYDYAAGINENLEKRWIVRHRLEKKNPNDALSEPVNPIVYYVDNGAPLPIQQALIEGAAWWNQAFEAAGFKNAFQVKVLPADADPMDVRYNVINWVHRSTRGWAYGSSIEDPRTGEIIKGDVTLDSQRARQDFLIGSGLTPQYSANAMCDFGLMPDVDYLLNPGSKDDANTMSLARIRQLSAHEVGHTLGFAHNFAASTYGRASVMDYPAPLVEIRNGKLDLSNAYAKGIGEFDKFSVRYAYSDFGAGRNEKRELEKIVSEGISRGMLFLSDNDTRPANAAHPLANLWDNGSDPVAELWRTMQVRRIGLDQFGLKNISPGTPLSELENQFLPLYLHHRYQLTAAVKTLGGVYYSYSVRTANSVEPSQIAEMVPAQRQRGALKAVLDTIKPEELLIKENILRIIPPTAYGYRSARSELFDKRTDPIFDPFGAAEIAANLTISGLLEPNRAARLISFNSRDKNNPHFREVVYALIDATWKTPASGNANYAEIQRTIQVVAADQLMKLAAREDAQMQVRAVANEGLERIIVEARARINRNESSEFYRFLLDNIEKFLARPDSPRKQTEILRDPPGDPIG